MGKIREYSLKKSFVLGMAVTVAVIFVFSIFAIYGSYRLQKWIMPDSNEVYLTMEVKRENGQVEKDEYLMEYGREEFYSPFLAEGEELPKVKSFTIRRENAGFAELTPKRKAAYRFLNVMMFLLPVVFSAVGVGLCGWWFYRKKLAVPLAVLSDATGHICQRDLDFTVDYRSGDELGRLCGSFEEMRCALSDNYKELWSMIENRKQLQMSIAHDLRTPITIIKGYVEYLLKNLNREITREKEKRVLHNLLSATMRLERYTESIKNIGQVEETDIRKEECLLREVVEDMANDFALLADRHGKSFVFEEALLDSRGFLDRQYLCRVLENIMVNALRYAEHEIRMKVEKKDSRLLFMMLDDGKGFSKELLEGRGMKLFYTEAEGEHLGIGLAVSRILCEKMGGGLKLENHSEGGAMVTIWVEIQ